MAQVAKGLEGVVVSETSLSHPDGENGRLIYSGYEIADLANHATFEEVVHLLWVGHLPNRRELIEFNGKMASYRGLPQTVADVILSMPTDAEPMDVLRTAASAFGAVQKITGKATVEHAMALTAVF